MDYRNSHGHISYIACRTRSGRKLTTKDTPANLQLLTSLYVGAGNPKNGLKWVNIVQSVDSFGGGVAMIHAHPTTRAVWGPFGGFFVVLVRAHFKRRGSCR